MNKSIKKILFVVALTFSFPALSPMNVATADDTPTLTLVGENYSNASLIREYRDANDKEYISSFIIPDHLREDVEKSKEKVRAAKNVLFLYYSFKEDEQSLSRLKNESFEGVDSVLVVSDAYNSSFNSDLATSLEFVKNTIDDKASEDKYLDDSVTKELSDFEKGWTEKPSQNDDSKETLNDSVKEKETSNNTNTSTMLYVSIALALGLIGFVTFYILSRR